MATAITHSRSIARNNTPDEERSIQRLARKISKAELGHAPQLQRCWRVLGERVPARFRTHTVTSVILHLQPATRVVGGCVLATRLQLARARLHLLRLQMLQQRLLLPCRGLQRRGDKSNRLSLTTSLTANAPREWRDPRVPNNVWENANPSSALAASLTFAATSRGFVARPAGERTPKSQLTGTVGNMLARRRRTGNRHTEKTKETETDCDLMGLTHSQPAAHRHTRRHTHTHKRAHTHTHTHTAFGWSLATGIDEGVRRMPVLERTPLQQKRSIERSSA